MPLSVRDLRLHRILQRRPLGEMVRRGLSLRSRAGQEDPGRGRLSQRLRAEVRQHRAARHAVHGRYRHRHRRHVDQDRRQGEASSITNGARSRRWSAATRPSSSGWASMYRTAGRPDVPWRYDGAFAPDSDAAPAGRQGQLRRSLPGIRQDLRALWSRARPDEAHRADRPAWSRSSPTPGSSCRSSRAWATTRSTPRQVGQFAAIPGRHELGDVFERIPRPEQKPWKK